MPYYNKNYQNLPKKPVKTFQDLDVYRLALEANVFAINTIATSFDGQSKKTKSKNESWENEVKEIKTMIIKTLINCACAIPHEIAEAHSFRFGVQKECLVLLEKVMLNCNKMVVYLDQARDICATGVEVEKFEELQKKYLFIRRKVLNLQRSWQKYMGMPKGEEKNFNIRV